MQKNCKTFANNFLSLNPFLIMLYFATSNIGKFKEVKKELSKEQIGVKHLKVPYPEIQADTLKEVAKFGIEFLKKENKKVFLEDSGLFVHSLNHFPGVYSAYVFKTIGKEGILKLLEDKENQNENKSKRNKITEKFGRTAHFKTVIAYYNLKEVKFFNGICDGKISLIARGENGFGYDPIFIPKNSKRTFAEMSIEEKNSFSHRGKALRELIKELKGEV